MSALITASMPADMSLGGSWTIEWDAVDPVTGATIAGVQISDANVVGADMSPQPESSAGTTGPFMLVPGPNA